MSNFFKALSAVVAFFASAITIYIFSSGNNFLFTENERKDSEFLVTPNIGAEFFQNGKKKEIYLGETLKMDGGNIETITIPLEKKPFTISIAKKLNAELIRISASIDKKIFDKLKFYQTINNIEYFQWGTGLAQYNFSAFLSINGFSHHYLNKDRLIQDKDKYKIYFSKIYDEKYTLLSDWNKDIYLVIYYDINTDSEIDPLYELELVKLTFK